MRRALQQLILVGAAFVLPLSACAHGSEFLLAKVLLLKNGGARLEVTADYGDNPMIASEEEARAAVTSALEWRRNEGNIDRSAGPPAYEKRSQPDATSPLPVDPLKAGQTHQLLTGVWNMPPGAGTLSFKVPEGFSPSVILWMTHEDMPEEKPRWVMLVAGDESPPITLTKQESLHGYPWLPVTIAGICLATCGLMLRRPRWVPRFA